jgi:hypothetical protein
MPLGDPTGKWDEESIWGILDTVPGGTGQCVQAAILMEFGMRQLTVEAIFEFINASARTDVTGDVTFQMDIYPQSVLVEHLEQRPDPNRVPPIPPCAGCGHDEILFMYFKEMGGYQFGEGSCRVGNFVYPGFITDMKGEGNSHRTAEHDLLFKFEDEPSVGGPHYQTWCDKTPIWVPPNWVFFHCQSLYWWADVPPFPFN